MPKITTATNSRQTSHGSAGAERGRKKFLKYFKRGFEDPIYIAWERGYKWHAHEQWCDTLDRAKFRSLLHDRSFEEIAARAVRLESKTNLLFSFEKMALRDAVKSPEGAELFATGLFDLVYGTGSTRSRFERWIATVAELPRRQTRVVTWPVVTVFGFIALPDTHIFLKPNVTRRAAEAYGFDFQYRSAVTWETYASLLAFAEQVRRDLKSLHPRDMIDIQSFLWVQGSDEYP